MEDRNLTPDAYWNVWSKMSISCKERYLDWWHRIKRRPRDGKYFIHRKDVLLVLSDLLNGEE